MPKIRGLKKTHILLLFSLGLLLFLAVNTYINDSEIWGVSSSKNFPFDSNRPSYFYKILFHSYVKLPFFFDLTSFQTLVFSRIQFALLGLLIAYLTFLIGRKVSGIDRNGLVAFTLLITSSLFISRGFRIRSDILSAVFFYFCLYINFLDKEERESKKYRLSYAASIFAMLLSTPKALLFLPLLLVTKLKKKPLGTTLESVVISLIFFGALFFLFVNFRNTFWSLYSYMFSAFLGPHSNYMNSVDFYHISLFIKRNPLFFSGIIASLVLNYFFSKNHKRKRSWYWITVLAGLLVLFFPNKRPFFLLVYLPIFSISTAFLIDDLNKISQQPREKQQFLIPTLLLVAVGLGAIKHFLLVVEKNSNFEQKVLIEGLEEYVEKHSVVSYYDAFGVLPRKKFVAGFIGPEEGYGNSVNVSRVTEIKPEIIIYSGKVAIRGEEFMAFLQDNYTSIGYRVWSVATKIKTTKIKVTKKINGKKYRVLSQQLLLDVIPHFSSWKWLSLSYESKGQLTFNDVMVDLDGEVKSFAGSVRLDDNTLILIPEEIEEFRVSRLPLLKLNSTSNFNKGFKFDLFY